jgi:hypothetical protein
LLLLQEVKTLTASQLLLNINKMKTKIRTSIFCILLFTIIINNVYAQEELIYKVTIDFDTFSPYIKIDTSQPNNIWQIGKPKKTLFNSAYSGSNAIITDTVNPYPVINTSSFLLILPILPGKISREPLITQIEFYSKIDCDLADDSAIIEMSFDQVKWYNIGCDYNQNYIVCFDLPQLSGTNNNWKYTMIDIGEIHWVTYKQLYFNEDSLYLRFTFRSGNINSVKEGWIIDNLTVDLLMQNKLSIPDNYNNSGNFCPNPANQDYIIISYPDYSALSEIRIININGVTISQYKGSWSNNDRLDISHIKPGVYSVYLFSNNGEIFVKKLIKL